MALTIVRPDGGRDAAGGGGGGDRRRLRRTTLAVGLLVVLVVAVTALVSPLRQLLAQERRVSDTRRQITEFEASNGELSRRIRELETDIEIERLAREDLGLVRPGEEPYVLLPGDPATPPPPPTELRRPEPPKKAKSSSPTAGAD